MAKTAKTKRGRPRMRERTVWLGMKLSEEERNVVRKRAKSKGTTISSYIRSLIENDLASEQTQPTKRLSAKELLSLPPAERRKRLRRAAKLAAPLYEEGGELRIFEAFDPIIEY